ncbi:MAG: hypothetical protein AABZ77_06765 [Chloroflexota bacterium]
MEEPFDEYVDQFGIGAGVYGVILNFKRTNPQPVAPGNIPTAKDVGTIRMSLEHFKLMAFLLKRQCDDIEGQLGIEIPLPLQVMNALKIAPEDWQKFWQRPK